MKPIATAVILGPSGVGKTNITEVFCVTDITPERVRTNPRDFEDIHYQSKTTYTGILSLLESEKAVSFGGPLEIRIYPKVALFKVRGEDQVLFQSTVIQVGRAKKVEIFGPVLWELLKRRSSLGWVDDLLAGTLFVIILNPWARPLSEVKPESAGDPTSADGQVLVELLKKRNEKPESIHRRVTNIVEEMNAWQSIASSAGKDLHILEAVCWPYAEHTYGKPSDPGRGERLSQAKETIVALAKTTLTDQEFDLFNSLLKPKNIALSDSAGGVYEGAPSAE